MFRPLRGPGVAGRCVLIATCAFAVCVFGGRGLIAHAEPSSYAAAATPYGAEERAHELYLDGVEKLAAGHRDFARQTFEQLIARYPTASVAEDARRQLGELYRERSFRFREPAMRDLHSPSRHQTRPARLPRRRSPTSALPARTCGPARSPSWDQELRRNVSIQSKLRIDAGDRVFFSTGSAELGSRARSALAAQAKWLMRWREFEAAIEGHADEPGSEQENIVLSEQRAEAVRDRLIQEGVEPSRIAVVPLGRSIPIATCADADCRAQNRRAVTLVFATGTRERLGLVGGRAPARRRGVPASAARGPRAGEDG